MWTARVHSPVAVWFETTSVADDREKAVSRARDIAVFMRTGGLGDMGGPKEVWEAMLDDGWQMVVEEGDGSNVVRLRTPIPRGLA